MRRYVDVIVEHEPYVSNIEDIKVEIKRSKHETFFTIDKEPIILDDNGKDYVLTFCCIDYGGGGCAGDCVNDFNYIFRLNEWQFETLKTLIGFIGMGVNEPIYSCNPMQGKEPKSEVFKKVENTLKMLGNSKDLLEKMNLTNDNLFSKTFGFLNEIPIE